MKKRMSKRIVCSVLASAVFMAQLQMPSVEMNAYAIEEVAETEAENLIKDGEFTGVKSPG